MQSNNFPKPLLPFSLTPKHQHQALCKIVSCANNNNNNSSSSSANKHGFKLLGHSLGDIKSRINDFDGSEYIYVPVELVLVSCYYDFACKLKLFITGNLGHSKFRLF